MNKNVYCVLIGLFIATFALSSCDDNRAKMPEEQTQSITPSSTRATNR